MAATCCSISRRLPAPDWTIWSRSCYRAWWSSVLTPKKITATNRDITVSAILANFTYNVRVGHHIRLACRDKNVQPRIYVTGWLKAILEKHRQPNCIPEVWNWSKRVSRVKNIYARRIEHSLVSTRTDPNRKCGADRPSWVNHIACAHHCEGFW